MAEMSLQTIWEAIQQSKAEMTAHIDSKIEPLQTSLNNIHGALSSLGDQISELEQRVSSNEDNVDNLTTRVQSLEVENAYLKEKVDEAENRSRINNLRFINVPEKSEGVDVIGFLTQLILGQLGSDNFSISPVIERAHRTPSYNSNKSNKPRPIIAKFLHYLDKTKILRLAREKKGLLYKGSQIHIYPDFSADLVKRRRQFDTIKKKLRGAGCKDSLVYPCTLKVEVDGKPKLFRSADDAEKFFDGI